MSSKEYFLRMREQEFNALAPEVRSMFSYVEVRETSEWENNKDDFKYCELKKLERKAKDEVQKYLFEKRNK